LPLALELGTRFRHEVSGRFSHGRGCLLIDGNPGLDHPFSHRTQGPAYDRQQSWSEENDPEANDQRRAHTSFKSFEHLFE
jgi:hypothetical protein